MITGKDIYVCIEPVTYGRREYSPDARDDKSKFIKLPTNTPIDETIKKYFKKQGSETVKVKPEEATAMDKEAVINSLNKPLPETLATLEEKFKEKEFTFDKRWSLTTAKDEFEKALKEGISDDK